MKIYKSLKKIKKSPIAITIGIFDGVHIGHQKILKTIKKISPDIITIVLTFNNKNPLIPIKKRLELLEKNGVDITFLLDLKKELSHVEFLKIVKEKIDFSYLVLGKNAVFGHQKLGNEKKIKELEKKLKFKAIYIDLEKIDGRVVSTSYIKKLISKNKLKEVNHLFF